ncbi:MULTISPECIES: GFA family protein [Legionella]|uniref:Glutathione-dependent formaldehyde-activating enzyme n=1 Tax=Legionella drozanskii LLAP-1 TaxID=1212489 RepID=A0A0W0TBB5_9GAMM|nr:MULTISPECIES: GFA family protein [Legionella]KTC92899.1 Glutathione-dependent formaldehyde-activating enzyme [Legionella drozanskii LLAP-1]PJE12936.1 MAG: GFA family protein [Legionella sp.]
MKLNGSCHCQAVKFEVESHTPYPFMYCYCSICRKTAGGGGYAINIMGQADTLTIEGKPSLAIYHAIMSRDKQGRPKEISEGQRHFCKQCGSCLWIFDPRWPEWVYPFASAIDTPLPKPPERLHILLDYAANWCELASTNQDQRFAQFPKESIEEWHKRHQLYNL